MMKRMLVTMGLAALIFTAGVRPADAHVGVSIGIGLPGIAFYEPYPPVVYAPPAYYAPPVYYGYGPPAFYYGRAYYGGGYYGGGYGGGYYGRGYYGGGRGWYGHRGHGGRHRW